MSSNVKHPSHYNQYDGIEIITLVEQMNFNRGSAVKYIARAGFKDPAKEREDLEKALFCLKREIKKLKRSAKRTAPKRKPATPKAGPPTPTTVSLRPAQSSTVLLSDALASCFSD